MIHRAGFVVLAAAVVLLAFAGTAGALDCLEVMQYKYCAP